jgi:hypothetical protein
MNRKHLVALAIADAMLAGAPRSKASSSEFPRVSDAATAGLRRSAVAPSAALAHPSRARIIEA